VFSSGDPSAATEASGKGRICRQDSGRWSALRNQADRENAIAVHPMANTEANELSLSRVTGDGKDAAAFRVGRPRWHLSIKDWSGGLWQEGAAVPVCIKKRINMHILYYL